MIRLQGLAPSVVVVCLSVFLTGCNQTSLRQGTKIPALQGSVFGGQQPVTDSVIQLYQANTAGNGLAATPLITAVVTTSDGTSLVNANANAGNNYNQMPPGFFTIGGDYTCPSPGTQVYLVASGGNPGLSSGTNNSAIELMAALGSCGQLGAGTIIDMNEVTTVGSVAALYPFMTSFSATGSAASASSQLGNAFGLASVYMNSTLGSAPGGNLPSGYYASSTEINTLADTIAVCINSSSPSSSTCSMLFTAAKPSGGTAPTDTVGALLDILNNPTNNVTAIYNLSGTVVPFQPTLSSAPATWALPIVPLPITPVFLPAPGAYAASQSVVISTPVNNATIYYTTDGTTPTPSSSVYSSALTVSSAQTLKAIAVLANHTSSVGTGIYSFVSTPLAPTISPATGNYTTPQTVTVTSPTPGATLYCTTNGSTPTSASPLCTSIVTVSSSETLKAVAIAGSATSSTSSAIYTITNISGNINTYAVTPGIVDGDGLAATTGALDVPRSTVFDASGNLYISDYSGQRVRMVSASTGLITTVAGNGTLCAAPTATLNPCGDNGLATSANLYNPAGLAIDAGGNLYVTDYGGNRVRKFTVGGNITTIAGNGTPCAATTSACGDTGLAINANLKNPFGIAVDSSGNVYIADHADNRIREVYAATGNIATIAGTGTAGYSADGVAATTSKLDLPYGIALDASNNLYIADYSNQRVREVAASTGLISTVAGTGTACTTMTATSSPCGDGAAATSAQVKNPYGVAVDVYGNIYIADYQDFRIREIAAGTGNISSIAGSGASGFTADGATAAGSSIYIPYGVSVDLSGNVYFTTQTDDRVREINAATGKLSTAAGNGMDTIYPGNPYITQPSGVAFDSSGNLYVLGTYGSNIVSKVTPSGLITTVAGTGGSCSGYTTATPSCGDGGLATAATFNEPMAIAVDSAGNLYITDFGDNAVRMVSATTGNITAFAGNGTATVTNSSTATTGGLAYPVGIAVDSNGIVYVSEDSNIAGQGCMCVRKISAGALTTYVNTTGTYGYNYASGAIAGVYLDEPEGLAVDSSNNLYIADTFNYLVRKVTVSSGTIATVAGNGTACNSTSCGDGSSATTASTTPYYIALDSSSNLYITQSNENNVRKVSGGIMSTFAGNGTEGYSGDGGAATGAEINGPEGVTVDSAGNVYIADQGNNRVRVVYH